MHKIVLWHRYLCEITSFDQNMTYDVKKLLEITHLVKKVKDIQKALAL